MAPQRSRPSPGSIMSSAGAGWPSGVAKLMVWPAFDNTCQLIAPSLGSKSRAGRGMRTRATVSNQQNGRARGLACGEVRMRPGGILQGVGLVDIDLHGAGSHDLEQLFRHSAKILGFGGVSVQRR